VAVRVRPMWVNGREKGCKNVVLMDGNVTKIINPEDEDEEPREYAFDKSYWSHDRYKDRGDGVFVPDSEDSPYADQDMVWDELGSIILGKAMQGFNCTVFAYGQSGAGKSYSVVGYHPNVGIVPRCLKELFRIADENQDPKIKYQMEIAMVEIYMDEVYDLLVPRTKTRHPLKVFIYKGEVMIYDPKDRKNKDKIWKACKDYQQAEAFRQMGDKARTVRPTGMNPSSSRAHTVFIVRFTKRRKEGEAWIDEFRSKINLVDLAGSERPADTGLTGIGLEEGVAINSSLSSLGRVMKQLVDGTRVNYRSCRLTEVLAESLNGKAITIMIAALSPADINYNDTVSTLRFADNAKKMPVVAKKQLSPTEQLIQNLKAENDKLKALLKKAGITMESDEDTDATPEDLKKATNDAKAAADSKAADKDRAAKEAQQASQLAEAKAKEAQTAKAIAARAQSIAEDDVKEKAVAAMSLRRQAADESNAETKAELERKAAEAEENLMQAEAKAAAAPAEADEQMKKLEDEMAEAQRVAKSKLAEANRRAAEAEEARIEAEEAAEVASMQLNELMERKRAVEIMLADQQQDFAEKLAESEAKAKEMMAAMHDMGLSVKEIMAAFGEHADIDENDPYLFNLAEDPLDAGALLYALPDGQTKVKRLVAGDTEKAIKLEGHSVQPHHATFENTKKGCSITPEGKAVTFVNGEPLTAKRRLEHGDRLILGNEFAFRLVVPSKKQEREKKKVAEGEIYDWDACFEELAKANDVDIERDIAELRSKLDCEYKEKQQQLEKEKAALEAQLARERAKFQAEMEQLKRQRAEGQASDEIDDNEETQRMSFDALARQLMEQKEEVEKTLKDQANLASITRAHTAIDTDLRVVRSQMRELQPRLVEANRISKALSIGVKYSFKLLDVKVPSTKRGKKQGGAEGEGERRVVLQIMAEKTGERKLWTQDKFNRRLVRMVRIADMDEPPAESDEDSDPFWDHTDHILVGSCAVGLRPLLTLTPIDEEVKIHSVDGHVTGIIHVSITAVDSGGKTITKPLTDPQHLLGQSVAFRVHIETLSGLPLNVTHLFCRYSWFQSEGLSHSSYFTGRTVDHSAVFDVPKVEQPLLGFFTEKPMLIQVRTFEADAMRSAIDAMAAVGGPSPSVAAAAAAAGADSPIVRELQQEIEQLKREKADLQKRLQRTGAGNTAQKSECCCVM